MDENELYEPIPTAQGAGGEPGSGRHPAARDRYLAPFGRAQMDAATNLLDKAVRALDDGDDARARRFVDRAVALPWDEHEKVHPAAMMAHQQLFDAVTDALEAGGDEWLDAVTDTLASAPEEARYSLRDALTAMLHAYELTGADQRRLRRLIRDVPERAELPDLDLPSDQLATAVLEVLEGASRTPTRRGIPFTRARSESRSTPTAPHAGVSATRRSRCTPRYVAVTSSPT